MELVSWVLRHSGEFWDVDFKAEDDGNVIANVKVVWMGGFYVYVDVIKQPDMKLMGQRTATFINMNVLRCSMILEHSFIQP